MQAVKDRNTIVIEKQNKVYSLCYHCGAPCITSSIAIEEKIFCCEGCKLVYEILNENGLCDYYKLQSHPGLAQIKSARSDKYAYLDSEDIAKQLYKFTNGDHTIVTFYIPGVHCSSCMWLLEHLHKVNNNIVESRLNFTTKEVTIHFSKTKVSLRKVVELLATIGYEPYISLDEADKKKVTAYNKQQIYKLGIAGFCFGNIMMMSFPEYLSHTTGIEERYVYLFRYLNLVLSMPVFFYCASDFFIAAWKGIKQKTLNIDAPIALALVITFTRSIYEIISKIGGGYLDSMTGIVFFMLAGRVLQQRTYKFISFTRDYKSYFPIAVNVVTSEGIVCRKLQDLKEKDIVQVHNDEIIPADALVLAGKPNIDYSFVTGESEPVSVKPNDMVYAGGRQAGEQITIQIVKPVVGSYLTSLWNHYTFSANKAEKNNAGSAIHPFSKYFTWVLLGLSFCTAVYWSINDPSKILYSVTSMLIVACPCALLLSATFTNSNILRILTNNGLFLRDASVIEQLSKIDHIVFDKTGTITKSAQKEFIYSGHTLTEEEKNMLYSIVSPSKHPYSKMLASWIGQMEAVVVRGWREIPGKGIEAYIGEIQILVGSGELMEISEEENKATVYVKIGKNITGFHFLSVFRESVPQMISTLRGHYKLSVLSGDNDKQKELMHEVFGNESELLFGRKPIDKLHYVESLQNQGKNVMMIGDGLNDAGALRQSDVGITLTDDINNFTPSCDAILDAKKISLFPAFLRLAKASQYIIGLSFAISIVYNVIGLWFATQGLLKPVIAAILMPCSTLSIVILSSGISSLIAKRLHLSLTPHAD
jgi:Cu+-exporting ATPase